MIRIAQLGCGYWGPNLLRNFSAQPDCHVKLVVDQDPKRRRYVETEYPRTATTDDWHEATDDPEVDAIVVATPASTIKSSTKRPTSLSTSALTTAVPQPNTLRRTHDVLYSPPPAQARKSRDVRIRPSPGSIRTITSPSDTSST